MGLPAAKKLDKVLAIDTHIIMIPAPPGPPVPTPMPNPFNGMIMGKVSKNVKILKQPAAVVGSTAKNLPPHIPTGGPFQKPPKNQGKIIMGSKKVMINNKAAVRAGDPVMTCNDPADLPVGKVIAVGNVLIG